MVLTGEVGAAQSPDKIARLCHEIWGEKGYKILSPPHSHPDPESVMMDAIEMRYSHENS